MGSTTYLFGAGASFDALPIVKLIPDNLKNLANSLEKSKSKPEITGGEKFHAARQELIDDIKWLFGACRVHSSIDTFAKKLYITKDHKGLNKLKLVLSLFFAYKQAGTIPDKRYDSFFASIIRDSVEKLPSIKIISWNYDSQFELSFNSFTGLDNLGDNQKKLGVVTKFSKNRATGEGFSIYKINGTTSFRNPSNDHMVDFFYYSEPHSIYSVHGLTHYYSILKNDPGIDKDTKSNLSFAWEEEKNNIVESIIPAVKVTTELVVIGYSFPFFNRDVDRTIIKEGMPNLKKVYFQDIEPETIRERFLSIRDDIKTENLVCRKDVDQFLLPNELKL